MFIMLTLWLRAIIDNYQGEESDVRPRLELVHYECLI